MIEFLEIIWIFFAGAAAATILTSLYYNGSTKAASKPMQPLQNQDRPDYSNVIIGDSGGTNVRLQLIRLFKDDKDKKVVLKELTIYKSQQSKSLLGVIQDFLKDVPKANYPTVGVIGIAGPVKGNTCESTNVSHWPLQDGGEIAKKCKLKSFLLINDFVAAGYGVRRLKPSESVPVGSSANAKLYEGANSVKVIIGPGTGLGQGILVKNDADGEYEIYPSEGGHADFSIKNEEDWKLAKYAKKFIEHSKNVENLRGNRKVGRLSIDSLSAGPAVPCIYNYMKEQYPDLEHTLETDTQYGKAKDFNNIESKDIISMGLKNKDPLCMKVVEKITENYGTEAGNMGLKCMPYGGIYLIGGLTAGLKDFILNNDTFMNAFKNKGRMSPLMDEFKVLLVDPKIEMGLLGAEERARVELFQ